MTDNDQWYNEQIRKELVKAEKQFRRALKKLALWCILLGFLLGLVVGLIIGGLPLNAMTMEEFWMQQNAHSNRMMQQQLENQYMQDEIHRQMIPPNRFLSPC